MKITRFILNLAVFWAALHFSSFAQSAVPKPQQEKLLNGLKVLMWPDASAKNVEIRIRVHSGAAFDPQGKEGVMKMLAENIFPNESTREYFKDDLGGGLEVVTTYDYVQINASGKADSFLPILETLATAIANPTIDKETTAKLRTALTAVVTQLESDPAYVADRAAAGRLFGTFPYGRAPFGTPDSIKKIDFADLIDAKQRFLTADNATIAVSGNFDRSVGLRAIRRFFGAWLKSDKKVPPTFRQPDPPNVSFQIVSSPRTDLSALRFAARGTARKDKDFAASRVFANILEARLKARVPNEHAADVFVRVEDHVLPGMFLIGFSAQRKAGEGKMGADELLGPALSDAVTNDEFASARSRFADEWAGKDRISFWLDADTFGLSNVEQEMKLPDLVTIGDVNAYAGKIRKLPMVAILANTQPPAN